MAKKSQKPQSVAEKPSHGSDGAAVGATSLFGSSSALDPTLSSLFSKSAGPLQAPVKNYTPTIIKRPGNHFRPGADADGAEDDLLLEAGELNSDDDDGLVDDDKDDLSSISSLGSQADAPNRRQRKRKADRDDFESVYLERLAREEVKDAKSERALKRQKIDADSTVANKGDDEDDDDDDDDDDVTKSDADSDDLGPPPVHETLAPSSNNVEVDKAARTVFLGNVSNEAIISKSAKRALMAHLASHLPSLPADKHPHSVESIRFRSTAFAGKIPKKAAFARKDLMETTAKSTNAYAVYSTRAAARAAARKLNGSVVLGRHLRVDEIAHPAVIDHHRCVFVGNLGYVDDETQIKAAEKDAGYKGVNSKALKGDVEEGLWQQFNKAGPVESVRVVRDAKTRVGKGFAYVQFKDQNGVEAALLFNEKKYPPLLPRKLRVVRAKKPSTTAGARERQKEAERPKRIRGQEHTNGRAGKLLGKAGAANLRVSAKFVPPNGVKKPESFVFEGQRASSKSGSAGLKLNGKSRGKKAGKPTNRSAKRGANWKAKAKNGGEKA